MYIKYPGLLLPTDRSWSKCLLLPLLKTQPTTSSSPEVSISVHDYANVPTSVLLAAAEVQAREIFRHAGLGDRFG